jgi:redox-sensing transcriptional repressor
VREQVSESTTNRLTLYLRFLHELKGRGVKTVSSKVLAEQFGLNAALIRKDLAHFGDLGVRGVGYVVEDLRGALRSILGLDRQLKVAIIGAGNLGLALADYPGFRQEGFQIVALFDTLRAKVGRLSKKGVSIYDIRDLKRIAKREGITIAVIAVPAPSAQDVVNTVIQAGIKAVLNFSPGALRVPNHVKLKSVDLTVSLESLSFYLAREVRRNGHHEK